MAASSSKPFSLQVLRLMETSLLSIVLPGDAQSTRRLSEVFMGGSIPVFIGPPYHSMPFSDYVDYRCCPGKARTCLLGSWLSA